MTYRRRLASAAAVLAWIAVAPAVLADASFDPSVDGGAAGTSAAPILPIALALVVGIALIFLARTRGLGAVMTLIGTVAGIAIGGLFIAAGLFGDFSGRHQIFPIPIVIGIVIIAAVLFILVRGRRRSQPVNR